MNVSGSAAGFFNSQIVQAIEWAVTVDHVNILNESFGGSPFPDKANDPVALADNAAVQAGVVVVASSLPGTISVAQARARELQPGQWAGITEAQVPFPPNGVAPGSAAAILAAVEMDAFHSTVGSDSGNAWNTLAVNNAAPYTPKTVGPGGSASITLTITPDAPKGAVVHGYVQLETFNPFTNAGDEVVRIPYTYKVG